MYLNSQNDFKRKVEHKVSPEFSSKVSTFLSKNLRTRTSVDFEFNMATQMLVTSRYRGQNFAIDDIF